MNAQYDKTRPPHTPHEHNPRKGYALDHMLLLQKSADALRCRNGKMFPNNNATEEIERIPCDVGPEQCMKHLIQDN